MEEESWVMVDEDYPQLEKNYSNVSITVMCKTKKGLIFEGFYGFNQKKWYDSNGNVKKGVIAWTSK